MCSLHGVSYVECKLVHMPLYFRLLQGLGLYLLTASSGVRRTFGICVILLARHDSVVGVSKPINHACA